jgi:3-phosphoshikimate 1-carboxyvinyltransferase
MKYTMPSKIHGSAIAPASKSMMQRAVIAAALAQGKSLISNPTYCDDALAAISCAKKLGARVRKAKGNLEIIGGSKPRGGVLYCGESGLCMRMLAPIAALFGKKFRLAGKGSLLSRDVSMIAEPLRKLGAACSTNSGKPPILVQGPLSGGEIEIDGSASSQFLTGLLMALPLCPRDSVVSVKNLKSKPYIHMTLGLLRQFGITVRHTPALDRFEIQGSQHYKAANYNVEGDWSGASFLLVAGAIAGRVEVSGLDVSSPQADLAILDALRKAGANVLVNAAAGNVSVAKASLRGFELDASDCPDLFPPLVALACSCSGESVFSGAGRLLGKESDRGLALEQEFRKLGADIKLEGGSMRVMGGKLRGGTASSHNDHRIAMALAVTALASEQGVRIKGEQCVSKSYPRFFHDLRELGAKL